MLLIALKSSGLYSVKKNTVSRHGHLVSWSALGLYPMCVCMWGGVIKILSCLNPFPTLTTWLDVFYKEDHKFLNILQSF